MTNTWKSAHGVILKPSATGARGLIIGFHVPNAASAHIGHLFVPNAFLRFVIVRATPSLREKIREAARGIVRL
jgi:hypothetical protein